MGYSNPKCYARVLGDCATKLSDEHYIPENVLLKLSRGSKFLDVTNHPQAPGKTLHRFSIARLAPRILCTKHNSALHPLDDELGRFFDGIRLVVSPDAVPPEARTLAVKGDLVERALVKLYCGWAVAPRGDAEPLSWVPPESWVRSLFSDDPWPRPQGLYSLANPGDTIDTRPKHERLGFGGWTLNDERAGLWFELAGVRLVLATLRGPPFFADYRPAELRCLDTQGAERASMRFVWLGESDGARITMVDSAALARKAKNAAKRKRRQIRHS